MTTKCVSLYKELEESQNALSNYESAFEESKVRAAKSENMIRDLEGRREETVK